MLRFDELMSGKSNSIGSAIVRAGLWCLSQPYSAAIRLRNFGYERGILKSHAANVPVISVGNLTAGGTGKTPTVAYLAHLLRDLGVRVAIVSRGYGSGSDGRNDEARELELRLPDVPHLQGANRVASAQVATEELDMQVLLLDDGFQHRRLKRDLEIVLLDAREPFGYEFLLPRGLLREPISAIRRAHIVMATRADQVDAQRLAEIRTRVQRYNPKAAWIESEHAPTQLRNSDRQQNPIDYLANKNVVAFCGIGNPASFFQTVRDCKINILEEITYPDHHAYTAIDLQSIDKHASQYANCDAILCTGKDLAKIECSVLGKHPLWSVDVQLRLRVGAEVLADYLEPLIAPLINRE